MKLEEEILAGGLPRIAEVVALLIDDHVACLGRRDQLTFRRRLAAILSLAGSPGKDSSQDPGSTEDKPSPMPRACSEGVATPDNSKERPVGNVAKPRLDPQPEASPATASSTRSPDLDPCIRCGDPAEKCRQSRCCMGCHHPVAGSVLNALRGAESGSRIIRSGDLTPGKRYRVVEIATHEQHHVGDIFMCVEGPNLEQDEAEPTIDVRGRWFVARGDSGTFVTAVELVEDEAEQHPRGFDINAEEQPDPTIIHAAEGVTLEPGSYLTEPGGTPFEVKASLVSEPCVWGSRWCFAWSTGWAQSVRRVETKAEAGKVEDEAADRENEELRKQLGDEREENSKLRELLETVECDRGEWRDCAENAERTVLGLRRLATQLQNEVDFYRKKR